MQADIASIEDWGARLLVSLIEHAEFAKLGVATLPQTVQHRRFSWHVLDALGRGEHVVFHCAAGLGRTGTMVAKLLVDCYGIPAAEAIIRVCARRPGAIDSSIQEEFIDGPRWFAMRGSPSSTGRSTAMR